MQEAGQSLPRARQGDDLEYFLPPIARPKVNKNYFRKPSFPCVRSGILYSDGGAKTNRRPLHHVETIRGLLDVFVALLSSKTVRASPSG